MIKSSASELACAHCGTLCGGQDLTVDADGNAYCCSGCEAVAALISASGWDSFYEARSGDSPRPVKAETARFDSDAFAEQHVTMLDDGQLEACLRVGGLRCAACVWLNERAIGELEGVADAHVSYGTGLATVRWDPNTVALSQVADRIAMLGYQPLPVGERVTADRDLLLRLGVAAFCAINVMLINAAVYLSWFSEDMQPQHLRLFEWAALLLATPAVFYSAAPFFDRAIGGLKHRIISMDVPIAVAIAVMYAHALWGIRAGEPAYLDSMTMLIALLLGGQVVVSRGRQHAEQAAQSVLEDAPSSAWRRDVSGLRQVEASEIAVDDVLVLGGGAALIADGIVCAGTGWVDRSHVTGESRPVEVTVGSVVEAGSRLVDGQLDVRVTATPAASTMSQISTLVRDALQSRSAHTALSERIAPWFTLAVIIVAAIVGAFWAATAGVAAATPIVVSVLVVACPCALALATPAAAAAGIGAAARHGAFVRDGESLDRLRNVDVVAFDKTGTLTEGVPRIVEATDDAICWAAPLEVGSTHPVARAVLQALDERGLPLWRAEDVNVAPGVGVSGTVHGRDVCLKRNEAGGVAVWVDDELRGVLLLSDVVRADAESVVARIGAPVVILSGDDNARVSAVATELHIHEAFGELSPSSKAEWVARRQTAGERVLFAGDGLNDAPGLAAANVAVAMGSGVSAARKAADVVVLTDELRPLLAARAASREAHRALQSNVWFSLAYNVVAVSLAAAGAINPLIAAILMPLSSGAVILNALSIGRRVDQAMT